MTAEGVLASRLLVLTDRHQAGSRRELAAVVAAAVAAGARAVVLREKDLCDDERAEMAWSLRTSLDSAGASLLLAGPDVDRARMFGAAGVHLGATDRWPTSGHGLVVGRSCHTAEEVAGAAGAGADYVTLSPVFPSPSKPGYGPPLGLDGLASVVEAASVPVVALGGITAATAGACFAAGAAAVAVMGAVMSAEDPAAATAALLAALAGAEPG